MTTGEPMVYRFAVEKVNKQSTIYRMIHANDGRTFMTDLVKIEKFQGYSKAYNAEHYFRLRNCENWNKCEQVTGLWKTTAIGMFFGDRREPQGKRLLLFRFDQTGEEMAVFVYPSGYYPSRTRIDDHIQDVANGRY